MHRRPLQLSLFAVVYGLDIETDTASDGLDPRVARILAIAVSSVDGEVVFTGPERTLLAGADRYLRRAPPGVLATWNGSRFDLPFLADRAARCRVRLGLRLWLDAGRLSSQPAPADQALAYLGRWHRHVHLDAYRVYRWLGGDDGPSCALKAVARSAGLAPVEEDGARVHELSPTRLCRYVASDARMARLLAERQWREAAPFLDLAPSGAQAW
ncbi:MAG: hypothetical protein M3N68_07680 [Actinomycetota bacterium]|nr:hypothetical protein [Actinomycetota bacterium]